jgi:hypothetical protein
VIDAGIEAHLAQQQHVLPLGVAVQIAHRSVAVRNRKHVRPVAHAVPCHEALEHGREHIDHDIRLLDVRGPTGLVVDVETDAASTWVAADAFAGEVFVEIADRDVPVMLVGQLE